MSSKKSITAVARPQKANAKGEVWMVFRKVYHLGKANKDGQTKYPIKTKNLFRKDGSKLEYLRGKASKKQIENLKTEAEQLIAVENARLSEQKFYGVDISKLNQTLSSYWGNLITQWEEQAVHNSDTSIGIKSYSTIATHKRVLEDLKAFRPEIQIGQLNTEFTQDFYYFMSKQPSYRGGKRSPHTIDQYLTKYKFVVNRLKDAGLIKTNILKIDTIQKKKNYKPYLTIEEVKKLVDTPITKGRDSLRRAFIFSCTAGLRVSDIYALKWGDIVFDNGKYKVKFVMQKTNRYHTVHLNSVAVDMIFSNPEGITPENYLKHSKKQVFFGVTAPNNQGQNVKLSNYVKYDAGIDKHVTFKNGRDSFAVNYYIKTLDILATSRLLGHTTTRTTQEYLRSYGVVTNQVNDNTLIVPEL